MKRYIKSAISQDTLDYNQKEQIADELFRIVENYFDKEGVGRPKPHVKYSQYDILGYTFEIASQTYNSSAQYVASTDYKAPDLNEFKKRVRVYLKGWGFSRVRFDMSVFRRSYEWYGERKVDKLKCLDAIYFDL